ncbi:hypothetical protein [Litchfieldia salsa]|uniref:Uncharacterized protein n=1 Tax=Litchfieldia salsa TaxID=930152 RepID=A0A1H0PX45_9BACI|nr:hypothetical protein [Litchfieldia salsa]SDP09029.1 hypothetical protein SAMN05216565_101483 [Litchfieldia salsa]
MGDLIKWECFEQYREEKRHKEKRSTSEERSKDWDHHVLPQLEHNKLNPLLTEMKEARATYFMCLKEYDTILSNYQCLMDEIYQQKSYQRLYSSMDKNERLVNQRFKNLPLITHDHLRYFQCYKDIPTDILE